jgi:hypothetical protein
METLTKRQDHIIPAGSIPPEWTAVYNLCRIRSTGPFGKLSVPPTDAIMPGNKFLR